MKAHFRDKSSADFSVAEGGHGGDVDLLAFSVVCDLGESETKQASAKTRAVRSMAATWDEDAGGL